MGPRAGQADLHKRYVHYWMLVAPKRSGFQVRDHNSSHTVVSMTTMQAVPLGPTLWKWQMWDSLWERRGPRNPTYGYEDVTLTITELAREGEVRQDIPSGCLQ